MKDMDSKADKVALLIRDLLVEIGEDPEREGLVGTPGRASRALQYFTQGYRMNVEEVLAKSIFEEQHEQMVILKNIDFFSLCEHHMVPFFGKCHIAYLPKQHIVGLSKLGRIVDIFARRLQVQERMTREIAHAIRDHLDPYGVAVVIEAQHLCMMMRGVEKVNSVAATSAMLGTFKEDAASRMEFLSSIGGRISGC